MRKGGLWSAMLMAGCVLETDPTFYLDDPTDQGSTGTVGMPAGTSSGSSSSGEGASSGSSSSENGTSIDTGTSSENGTSSETGASATLPCARASLGSAVGMAVATGTTAGSSDSWSSSCSDLATADVVYEWTAPLSGTFTFDTSGSYFDTVVTILQSCEGPEIACDDDTGDHLWSTVTADLQADDVILIVIDGWSDTATGTYQLNIAGP